MSNDSREAFEDKFPISDNIFYDQLSGTYKAKDQMYNIVATIYNYQWGA
jgi:hypothetical protein